MSSICAISERPGSSGLCASSSPRIQPAALWTERHRAGWGLGGRRDTVLGGAWADGETPCWAGPGRTERHRAGQGLGGWRDTVLGEAWADGETPCWERPGRMERHRAGRGLGRRRDTVLGGAWADGETLCWAGPGRTERHRAGRGLGGRRDTVLGEVQPGASLNKSMDTACVDLLQTYKQEIKEPQANLASMTPIRPWGCRWSWEGPGALARNTFPQTAVLKYMEINTALSPRLGR